MRLFVGIPLNSAFRSAIAQAVSRMPVDDPGLRWTRPELWHITLMFLGECEAETEPAIRVALEEVAARAAPVTISPGAFDVFPAITRPRVLVVDVVDDTGKLEGLAARVRGSLSGVVGGAADARPFRAHVTVARARRRVSRGVAKQLSGARPAAGAVQDVDSFALIESRLLPSGARHTVRKLFALGGGA